MQIHLLGTTGYHPNDQRHTACMMLPELGVVLDAGTAMFRVRDHLQTKTLDIFLSHAHLDHVIGLTFLFDVLWQKNVEKVRVHGDPRKLAAIERHLFATELFPVRPPFDFVPLADEVRLADGARLTHFPLEHPGGSLGYRIDWPDRSLAYVTDTTARRNAAYLEKIRGVDLLLHECYFPDGLDDHATLTGHSWTTPVAQVAAAAAVKRAVLVHVNPLASGPDPLGLAAAKQIFPALELASDRQIIDF